MADIVDTRGFRDVLEMAAPVVLEQNVAAAYRGDKQVLIPVVVDVRKRGGDTDPVGQGHAGAFRDIREPPTPQVLPQLVPTKLIHEVNIFEPVAIDVGGRDSRSVIVMDRLLKDPRVVHDVFDEGDPAFFELIPELKLVEDLELPDGFALGLRARAERADVGIRAWIEDSD